MTGNQEFLNLRHSNRLRGFFLGLLVFWCCHLHAQMATAAEPLIQEGCWESLGPVSLEKRDGINLFSDDSTGWQTQPAWSGLKPGFRLIPPPLTSPSDQSWFLRKTLYCNRDLMAYWILETTRPGKGWLNNVTAFRLKTTFSGSSARPWYAVRLNLKKGKNTVGLRIDRITGVTLIRSEFRVIGDPRAEKARFISLLRKFPRIFQNQLAGRIQNLMKRKRCPKHLIDKHRISRRVATRLVPIPIARRE